MRRRTLGVLLAVAVMAASAPAVGQQRPTPRKIRTPLGQVKVVTVNARQNAVLGLKRFEDMYELSWGMRVRPAAFNGGAAGAVAAPDVVALQEVRANIAEIYVHLLRQRFKIKYQLVGLEDVASQMLYNPETVTPQGDVVTWEDVCSERTPGRRDDRVYQFARFTERQTNAPFTVAAMHIPKNFKESGGTTCYVDNITELRSQLATETGAVFVVGDFNRRAVEVQHECDPNERSAPFEWYSMMTAPTDGGRAYTDAVRFFHRERGLSLNNQWTHEQKGKSLACDGSTRIRRTRIDYMFVYGASVVEASVDAPGWAGSAPGSHNPNVHKYSDHRYVWGRFVVQGPERVTLPDLIHGKRGAIAIAWELVTGAEGYLIYRATEGEDYALLGEVDGTVAEYVDDTTSNAFTYKYAVAPVDATEAQGQESRPARILVDKKGPSIVSVSPVPGATGIDPRVKIRIVFSERIRAESVRNDRIRLYRGSKRIPGTVKQVAPRVLVLDPTFPLWKGKLHHVVVKPLQDKYANVGGATNFSFTIKHKRKKHDGKN